MRLASERRLRCLVTSRDDCTAGARKAGPCFPFSTTLEPHSPDSEPVQLIHSLRLVFTVSYTRVTLGIIPLSSFGFMAPEFPPAQVVRVVQCPPKSIGLGRLKSFPTLVTRIYQQHTVLYEEDTALTDCMLNSHGGLGLMAA